MAILETCIVNAEVLKCLKPLDSGSPTELKLLDKVLLEEGAE